MRRSFIIFLLYLPLVFSCRQSDRVVKKVSRSHSGYEVKIEIPTTWIDSVRRVSYGPADTILLQKFEKIIAPDTLLGDRADRDHKAETIVFDPMFIDLDGEPGDELISLLGWSADSPSLGVFKEIQGTWYLIYLEPIYTFYGAPKLMVASTFTKNKTFYLKRVHDHGSGVYEDGYSFYKLINNKVHRCLELVNKAHIYGWGLFLNQEIRMSFEFAGDHKDCLGVTYSYNFFPGAIYQTDCPWCTNVDIPLIKGDDKVWYTWDANKMIYKFDAPSTDDQEALTAEQIACFGSFGNDSLFVSAFKRQIDDKLKNGDPQQKKILTMYLKKLKKDKTVTTAKLKVISKAGGTTFYGTDK